MDTTPSTLPATAAVTSPPASFKYATEFGHIVGCPFKADAGFAEESYRIVHSDGRHPDNFLPVARLNPERSTSPNPTEQCGKWALSMFEKREQLKTHILKIERYAPRWRARVGDHGARLKLTPNDGRRTASRPDGHFSFFEFSTFDGRTAIVEHFPIFV